MVTFDMYSALLDIFSSAVPLMKDVLDLPEESCDKLFRTWRSEQWLYMLLNGCTRTNFISYSDITKRALDYTEFKLNYSFTPEQKEQLLHHVWENFKAWPEAKEVLDELKARGYTIAMLSNGDRAMLEPLQQSTGIHFDHIFAADMARCHKPGPEIYALPTVELGMDPADFLHVCGSANDLMGASYAGIQCAWHNRRADRPYDPNIKPVFEVRNLYGLLDHLPPIV